MQTEAEKNKIIQASQSSRFSAGEGGGGGWIKTDKIKTLDIKELCEMQKVCYNSKVNPGI